MQQPNVQRNILQELEEAKGISPTSPVEETGQGNAIHRRFTAEDFLDGQPDVKVRFTEVVR